MITISQAAAGLAIAGTAPGEGKSAVVLPAGVFETSTDHLAHALMSAERFHPIPPECPTDYVRPLRGPFEPLFFSMSQFSVLRRLIELLLGEASEDASVSQEIAEWVDLRVSSAKGEREAFSTVDPLYRALAAAYSGSAEMDRLYKANPADICRDGLDWIANTARAGSSKEFLKLDVEQQISLLDAISDERPEKRSENAGTRFFEYLKAETIRGFYTSQAGLKELDFKGNAFYARSPGCLPK